MCCQHDFLPNFISPEAKKMNNALQLPKDAQWFYVEDSAPGHSQERKNFNINVDRMVTPKNATPRFAVGDQMHGWINDLGVEEEFEKVSENYASIAEQNAKDQEVVKEVVD